MSDPGDLRWLVSLSLTGRPPRISVDPLSPEDARERIERYRNHREKQAEEELAEIEKELLRRKLGE